MSGVSFVDIWEIGTSSTVVREVGTVTSFAGIADFEVRTSIADVGAFGSSASIEDV